MELLNRVFLARNIAIRLRTGGYQASDKAEKDLETHDWQKRVTREWTTGIGFFCSEQGLQSNNSRQLILACIGTRGLLKDVWPTLSVPSTVPFRSAWGAAFGLNCAYTGSRILIALVLYIGGYSIVIALYSRS
jgi:hypothetical protein